MTLGNSCPCPICTTEDEAAWKEAIETKRFTRAGSITSLDGELVGVEDGLYWMERPFPGFQVGDAVMLEFDLDTLMVIGMTRQPVERIGV